MAPSARRGLGATAGLVAGSLLGALAERAAHLAGPTVWAPDLAVGWSFIAGGVLAWYRRAPGRAALLLVAVGVAWFVPNVAPTLAGPLAWAAAHSLYLHRGPLVHLLLTFPTGRAQSWWRRGAVTAGYVAAIVTPVWRSDPTALVLAAALVGVVLAEFRRTRGRARLAGRAELVAAVLLAAAITGGALARLVAPSERVIVLSRWTMELGLCLVAVWLVTSLLLAPWDRVEVTDLVVELGEAPSDALRDQLARALGDPGLVIGYGVAEDRWVDARGDEIHLPGADAGRSVTVVRASGRPVAALVHDPDVLDSPALVEAVRAVTRLAAANVSLQTGVRAQVTELDASRRRLLEAADDERRRLEQRLHDGALQRLHDLGAVLSLAGRSTRLPDVSAHLDAASGQLRDSVDDLLRLGQGLHPRELDELGLEGALLAAAARSPVPVVVRVDAGDVPLPVAAGAYYVCLEGLSNAVKHAQAEQVSLTIGSDRVHLHVEVADDGVGGASPDVGGGLRGLTDRVDALGGSLSLESPGGEGTRLAARIPLGRPRPVQQGGPGDLG